MLLTPDIEKRNTRRQACCAVPLTLNLGDGVAIDGDWGRAGFVEEIYSNGIVDIRRGDELIVEHVSRCKKISDRFYGTIQPARQTPYLDPIIGNLEIRTGGEYIDLTDPANVAKALDGWDLPEGARNPGPSCEPGFRGYSDRST